MQVLLKFLFYKPKSLRVFHLNSCEVACNRVEKTIVSFMSIIWTVAPILETDKVKAALNYLLINIAEKVLSSKLSAN